MGLKTSRFINRIVIDPRNNDVVFVAATGSLWGPGGERGVYKTTDGGKTWKQVLKVDDDTGANDLVMDATNNQILYATHVSAAPHAVLHERRRPGQRHLEVHRRRRDLDAAEGRRLPDGPLGRIALDVYRRRPNILYALIEGQAPLPAARGAAPAPPAAEGGAGRAAAAATSPPA